ncbi:type II secretion system GspH family protein [Patescibacteria group bacterium]|nr:type II secretion system GspH family protein [Patescibacteria group bacterium]
MNKNKKGFTLIELLVVIAIIGLLSTLAIVALNSVRQKSRDAKRVADVKQIQTALELYYNDHFGYPDSTSVTQGEPIIGLNDVTYMAQVPEAPEPADNPSGDSTCVTGDTNDYNYIQDDDGSSYSLDYCIGANTGNVDAGLNTATPAGIHDN